MALIACPECGRGVSEEASACPGCGHPLREPPGGVAPVWRKRAWGFEWRSKAQVLGWPLVHVAIGRDPATRKLRVAKGVIAMGQFAFGLVTIAQIGLGKHVWSTSLRDPEAVEHFTGLWNAVKGLLWR